MSQESYLALNDLKVTVNIVLEHLMDLTIEKEINQHTRLRLAGMISEEKKEKLIEDIRYNGELKLTYEDEKVLFSGNVTPVELMMIEGV